MVNDKAESGAGGRVKAGKFCAVLGIAANVTLAVLKMAAGVFSHSVSVIADAVNNLSDVATSVVSLIGFRMSGRSADEEHPFGHGRAEYMSGVIVSVLIMVVGVELFRSSAVGFFTGGGTIVFHPLTVAVLVFSIAVKLFLFVLNRRVAARINSAALKAVALDSLSDMAATGAVLAGFVITKFAGEGSVLAVYADPAAGAAVSVFIFINGLNAVRDCISPLIGRRPDSGFVREIRDSICAYDDVLGVHDLIVHDYGVNVSVISFHLELAEDMKFNHAHELADRIEKDLTARYGCTVTIHMDPLSVSGKCADVKARITKLITAIDTQLCIQDFRMVECESGDTLLFEIAAPFNCRMNDDEIKSAALLAISALYERYTVKIEIDRKYS